MRSLSVTVFAVFAAVAAAAAAAAAVCVLTGSSEIYRRDAVNVNMLCIALTLMQHIDGMVISTDVARRWYGHVH